MPPSSHSTILSESLLVSGTDVFALGHYPAAPIYPGVILLDRMLALANRLATDVMEHPTRVRTVSRVQYLDAILPGDVVDLQAAVRTTGPEGLTLAATAGVRGAPSARASFTCGSPCPAIDPPAALQAQPLPVMTHRDIAGLLPHRYPFLLVDAVQAYTPGSQIRACKLVTRQSPLFAAQAPDTYPAGLAIESLGQAGIALFFLGQTGRAPVEVVLGAMTGIELLHDIPFDSVLTLDARIDRLLPNAVVFGGEIRIGPTPVIRVGSLVAMIDPRHVPS
ncbi:beta-hydroxyacyl-ACP dehydratase [Cupriavidus campinensis]